MLGTAWLGQSALEPTSMMTSDVSYARQTLVSPGASSYLTFSKAETLRLIRVRSDKLRTKTDLN